MATLRTPATEQQYKEWRAQNAATEACALCDREPLHRFHFWKIVTNKFPYDLVARTHELLVPLRHVSGRELSEAEKDELDEIKETYLGDHYELILENTRQATSIPGHFHLHLITLREDVGVPSPTL